ncbi:MAG: DUF368 domain-containing protein [Clostridia bacterium]|nr:DUF368 domain-containing protein [Clostridia bacterium]
MAVIAGFSIGLSVIVPGISGSAIAMVLRIYDKLMYAFSNLFKKFKLCVLFLIPILIGIVLGFGIGFILVKLLLDLIPFITICFFVGLMIGTYPLLFKEIKGEKDRKGIALMVIGVLIPLLITVVSLFINQSNSLSDVNAAHYILFLVIGILISLTQLIPGLSATVLLMICGYYTALMDGINIELVSNAKLLLVYVVLVVGFVIGTLLFSKIINRFLNSYRRKFFFVICGLAIGSVFAVFLGSDCLEIYKAWSGNDIITDIIFGVLALAVGFVISFMLYILEKKKEAKENSKILQKN